MRVLGPGDPVFEAVGIALVLRELDEFESRWLDAADAPDRDVERVRELIVWGRGWAARLAGGDG